LVVVIKILLIIDNLKIPYSMPYLFTSESVSEGHPDKVADQISDALIDNFLAFDPNSKVACETLVTTGQVILAGEVKSNTYLDVQQIARDVIKKIGYTKSEYMFEANSCGVLSAIHEQSSDINQGVVRTNPEDQGAGDQGMMFGYASNETQDYMPLALDLSHKLLRELAELRRENNEIKYLRPDSKSQVTLEYDDQNKPSKIVAIVISTQHDDFDEESYMLSKIKSDVINILIPRIIAKYPHSPHLSTPVSNITSTRPASLSSAVHMVTPGLPDEKLLWIPMAEKVHTVEVLSPEKTQAKWTEVPPMLPVTLPKIWLLPGSRMKY